MLRKNTYFDDIEDKNNFLPVLSAYLYFKSAPARVSVAKHTGHVKIIRVSNPEYTITALGKP